jgi:hypothetical protein
VGTSAPGPPPPRAPSPASADARLESSGAPPLAELVQRWLHWMPATEQEPPDADAFLVSGPIPRNDRGDLAFVLFGFLALESRLSLRCEFRPGNATAPAEVERLMSLVDFRVPPKFGDPTRFNDTFVPDGSFVPRYRLSRLKPKTELGQYSIFVVLCRVPAPLRGEPFSVQVGGDWTFAPLRVEPHELLPRPRSDAAHAVSLTHCSNGQLWGNALHRNDRDDAGFHYLFHRLVEFIEWHRYLGVRHFTVYLVRMPHPDDVLARRAMAYYVQSGVATFVNASAYPAELRSRGQLVSNADCLERQRYQFAASHALYNDIGASAGAPAGVSLARQTSSSSWTGRCCASRARCLATWRASGRTRSRRSAV